MSQPDRGYAPIRGESRLPLVAMAVVLSIAGLGLLGGVVASFFFEGLGPTVVGAAVFFFVAAIAFAVVFVQRRSYLRDVMYGRVVVREPWSGADILPPT